MDRNRGFQRGFFDVGAHSLPAANGGNLRTSLLPPHPLLHTKGRKDFFISKNFVSVHKTFSSSRLKFS